MSNRIGFVRERKKSFTAIFPRYCLTLRIEAFEFDEAFEIATLIKENLDACSSDKFDYDPAKFPLQDKVIIFPENISVQYWRSTH